MAKKQTKQRSDDWEGDPLAYTTITAPDGTRYVFTPEAGDALDQAVDDDDDDENYEEGYDEDYEYEGEPIIATGTQYTGSLDFTHNTEAVNDRPEGWQPDEAFWDEVENAILNDDESGIDDIDWVEDAGDQDDD